jgi:hypothetical protein
MTGRLLRTKFHSAIFKGLINCPPSLERIETFAKSNMRARFEARHGLRLAGSLEAHLSVIAADSANHRHPAQARRRQAQACETQMKKGRCDLFASSTGLALGRHLRCGFYAGVGRHRSPGGDSWGSRPAGPDRRVPEVNLTEDAPSRASPRQAVPGVADAHFRRAAVYYVRHAIARNRCRSRIT